MRTRLTVLSALLGIALISSLVAVPAQAEEPKVFEANILAPAGGAEVGHVGCPDGGPANGSTYVFIDLEGDFTFFKASGPAHLVNEPSPVGVHDINDYDIDLFVFDAKCKQLPDANGPAGTEKLDTKRPARYALISYWSGVIPNLPITLEASNSRIK